MRALTSVTKKINLLTNDEDLRQELWLYYLEGNPFDTLSEHFNVLKRRIPEQKSIDRIAYDLIKSPLSDNTAKTLQYLTELEKSIILMLLLDRDLSDISKEKNISEIKVQQMVNNIKRNSNWNRIE